jgi:hypothetical protein
MNCRIALLPDLREQRPKNRGKQDWLEPFSRLLRANFLSLTEFGGSFVRSL